MATQVPLQLVEPEHGLARGRVLERQQLPGLLRQDQPPVRYQLVDRLVQRTGLPGRRATDQDDEATPVRDVETERGTQPEVEVTAYVCRQLVGRVRRDDGAVDAEVSRRRRVEPAPADRAPYADPRPDLAPLPATIRGHLAGGKQARQERRADRALAGEHITESRAPEFLTLTGPALALPFQLSQRQSFAPPQRVERGREIIWCVYPGKLGIRVGRRITHATVRPLQIYR